MLDDKTTQAMPDENNGTVQGFASIAVHALDQVFAAELEARLGSVRMPFRIVVVRQNSRLGHRCRQHLRVCQPVDVRGRFRLILPSPRPIHVRTETVYGDDAAHGQIRSHPGRRRTHSTSAVPLGGPA